MEVLLNPNVAYLLLVVGTLLTLLALVTPGTGMLEVGAFFCLFLAGYAAYNIPFNGWALLVMLASLIPFVYAIRKPGRTVFLLLTILGLVAGSVFLFSEGGRPVVNPFLATIVSLLSAGFIWLSTHKVIQAAQAQPHHNLAHLIGRVGEAKTDVHEEGSVQVAGELWSARSDRPIPAGSQVRVLGREGFVLSVEPILQPEK
jgi:membrane-bound serine protease (ClpP class)